VITRHRRILLLLNTILQTSGQFTVFVYLSPLLQRLSGAGRGSSAVCSRFMASRALPETSS